MIFQISSSLPDINSLKKYDYGMGREISTSRYISNNRSSSSISISQKFTFPPVYFPFSFTPFLLIISILSRLEIWRYDVWLVSNLLLFRDMTLNHYFTPIDSVWCYIDLLIICWLLFFCSRQKQKITVLSPPIQYQYN